MESAPRVRRALPVLLGGVLLASAPAQATNGYFSHGYSVAQRAMGGAGTAWAEDALAASSNPANLAFVPERLDFNLGLFSPVRTYRAGERGPDAGPGIVTLEPGKFRSRHEKFAIPALAYSQPLGPDFFLGEGFTWGVALYGNGGMNTNYRGGSARFGQGLTGFETHCEGSLGGGAPVAGATDNAGFCGNSRSAAGVDLIQLFVMPTLAYRIGDSSSVGISPVLAVQRFSAHGLQAFGRYSNAPTKVSDNGDNYSRGAGVRLGFTLAMSDLAKFGGSWQSRVHMSEFDKYAGLFADEGGFDVPSTWNVGVALQLPMEQRVLVDVQHVNYTEVPGVGNPLDPNRFINGCALPRLGGSTSASEACLGSATGPGFGWRDMTVHKFGYEIALSVVRLRAGYSRNRQPIPQSEVLFNILAPGVPQEHFTLGASYALGGPWTVDASATLAKGYSVTGKNPLSNSTASEGELFGEIVSPGSGNTDDAFGSDPDDQDLTLRMHQFELMFGLAYRF